MQTHQNGAADPKPHTNGAATLADCHAGNSDEFDALAGMFLDPAQSPAQPDPATTPQHANHPHRPEIVALMLGHLPVVASAWPAQHARTSAELTGTPVTIARLSNGHLSLELVGSGGEPPAFDNETDALQWAATGPTTVLVRVDEPDEPSLAAIDAVDRLVLLTGADDAAVVACYRKLKGIATDAERPVPPTQITVVGAKKPAALLAHNRIARAARTFLEAELLEPLIVDRVAPTGSQMLYRAETSLTAAELVEALRSAKPDASPTGPATDLRPAPPQDSPGVTDTLPPEPNRFHSNPRDSRPATPMQPATTPSQTSPPVHAGDHTAPPLVSLLPGLLPLETVSPAAPGATLAYDAAGSLHILVGSVRSQPDAGTTHPVAQLLCAKAWAEAHADLLGRAEPRLSADAARNAQLHLITDRPANTRPLRDTGIRLHLVTDVTHAVNGFVTISLDD